MRYPLNILAVASLVLSASISGCSQTPAERAATGSHPNARRGRGGPQNGYDFMLWPDDRARLIRDISGIASGTTADEVIAKLGVPDSDHADFESVLGPVFGREFEYDFAIYRIGSSFPGKDQVVYLKFSNSNMYGRYYTSGDIAGLKKFGNLPGN